MGSGAVAPVAGAQRKGVGEEGVVLGEVEVEEKAAAKVSLSGSRVERSWPPELASSFPAPSFPMGNASTPAGDGNPLAGGMLATSPGLPGGML